jgi:hypothetical protein
MEQKDIILEEITGLAPVLANFPKRMPFEAPAGYFDRLPLEVLKKTHKTEARSTIPEGYFDALPVTLLRRIRATEAQGELNQLAPTLGKLSRQMPYGLPEGYFENLQVSVKTNAAPVIAIRPKNTPFKWAAAASVVVLAGLFVWQMLWHTTASTSNVALNTNTSATDTAIYLALAGVGDASLSKELSQHGGENEIGNTVYYLHADNIETALHEISDEEIKNQLAATAAVNSKS